MVTTTRYSVIFQKFPSRVRVAQKIPSSIRVAGTRWGLIPRPNGFWPNGSMFHLVFFMFNLHVWTYMVDNHPPPTKKNHMNIVSLPAAVAILPQLAQTGCKNFIKCRFTKCDSRASLAVRQWQNSKGTESRLPCDAVDLPTGDLMQLELMHVMQLMQLVLDSIHE